MAKNDLDAELVGIHKIIEEAEASAKERERPTQTAIQEMIIANERDRDELKTYVSVTQDLHAWRKKEEDERDAGKQAAEKLQQEEFAEKMQNNFERLTRTNQ